jgi:hypothetical protein
MALPLNFRRGLARLARLLLAPVLCLGLACAWAQEDPPGRVGRVSDVQGNVSWWDHEAGRWDDAEPNHPLTQQDRISTGTDSRAELRIGSTTLRLGPITEVEVLRLDDERMVFQLHSGSLALRVRTRDAADQIELVTAEARLFPLRAGHYRLDRIDDSTQAGSWRGELRLEGPAGYTIAAGQQLEIDRASRREGGDGLRYAWNPMPDDGFAQSALREERRDERSASARYVSPEMTGAEDLDRAGRWEQHPEFGAVWFPYEVQTGWAPYRYGHWAWVRPWGWTWIDDANWGFAPFHYGRWVMWRNAWCWVPGAYVAQPVFAPALVAWVGASEWDLTLRIGGPAVAWVPLAPREPYAPHFRATPRYLDRVNPVPRYRWQDRQDRADGRAIRYGNQDVPGGLTLAPRDALWQRSPIGRLHVDGRDAGAPAGRPAAMLPAPPPPAPAARDRHELTVPAARRNPPLRATEGEHELGAAGPAAPAMGPVPRPIPGAPTPTATPQRAAAAPEPPAATAPVAAQPQRGRVPPAAPAAGPPAMQTAPAPAPAGVAGFAGPPAPAGAGPRERLQERPPGRSQERSLEKGEEKAQDRPRDKPQDRAQERPPEKAREKAPEKAQDKAPERAEDKAASPSRTPSQRAAERDGSR